MKYQQLLSRIGACIDRLVEMGFTNRFPNLSLSYLKTIDDNNYISSHVTFFDDKLMYSIDGKIDYIAYTDNFEQELFDKLKEI